MQPNDQEHMANGSSHEGAEEGFEPSSQNLQEWEIQLLQLKDELAVAKEESKKHQDQYLRALADFDNLRRRSIKEREELYKYGVESLLRDMLPVLDSFDTALKWELPGNEDGAEGKNLFAGIHLVKKQLLDILQKHGLTKIEAKGKAFDPNFHQAVAKIESEAPGSGEVVHEEFASGYMLHDRLLRPAMVSVKV